MSPPRLMWPGHDGPNAPVDIISNLFVNANYICDCGEMGASKIVNNTFIAGPNTGGGILLSDDGSGAPSRITLENNVFQLGGHWLVGGNLLGAQVFQDYNIAPGHVVGAHDTGTAATFADSTQYELAAGSAGLGAADPGYAPQFDRLGRPRVGAPDMGSLERQS